MISLLAKLLSILNSENSPRQIAIAIAFALIVGLTPMFSLHNLVLVFFLFIFKVNLSSFFFALVIFSGFSFALSSSFNHLGELLLTQPSLQAFWASLYQFELFKLAHLHHTVTLGSLFISLALCFPCYFLSHFLIVKYRAYLRLFINKFKVIQSLKASRFYGYYLDYCGNGGRS